MEKTFEFTFFNKTKALHFTTTSNLPIVQLMEKAVIFANSKLGCPTIFKDCKLINRDEVEKAINYKCVGATILDNVKL